MYNINMEEREEVEIECSASRSGITTKRFYFTRARRLEEMKEVILSVFELEGYLCQLRFYYQGKEVTWLKDIEARNPTLQLQL